MHNTRGPIAILGALGRAWLAANHDMGVASTKREIAESQIPCCGGEIGCQYLVGGECQVAPDDVGLRVSWDDKGYMVRSELAHLSLLCPLRKTTLLGANL